jgi:hypothetical protein
MGEPSSSSAGPALVLAVAEDVPLAAPAQVPSEAHPVPHKLFVFLDRVGDEGSLAFVMFMLMCGARISWR